MKSIKIVIPEADKAEIAAGAKALSLTMAAFVRLAALEKSRIVRGE